LEIENIAHVNEDGSGTVVDGELATVINIEAIERIGSRAQLQV
jgi:hypothetical protein